MAKVFACELSMLELQSSDFDQFRTYTIGKSMNPFIPTAMS